MLRHQLVVARFFTAISILKQEFRYPIIHRMSRSSGIFLYNIASDSIAAGLSPMRCRYRSNTFKLSGIICVIYRNKYISPKTSRYQRIVVCLTAITHLKESCAVAPFMAEILRLFVIHAFHQNSNPSNIKIYFTQFYRYRVTISSSSIHSAYIYKPNHCLYLTEK